MPKPLLYRPPPRWQLWTAFGGALLIHIGAVVAAIRREGPPETFIPPPQEIVEATIQEQPQPTPPPEDILVPPPPLPPEVKPEFVEERPLPPPQPKAAKVAPVKFVGVSTAKANAIFAPKPPYPYEARAHNITGSGVCLVEVDTPTGNVTSATMTQSIGNAILDNSATSTFRSWRFRPGTVSKVKIPITFTMTGASY
jgi:TonB family protein